MSDSFYGESDDVHRALREVRRFEEAATAHQEAAAIFRETGDRHREGIALKNLETAQAAVAQLVAPQDQRATNVRQTGTQTQNKSTRAMTGA